MSFVSFSFLFLLAAVLLARFTFGRTKQSPLYLAVLVLASLTFYAWHIPAYLLILLASTCVDYAAGDYLGRPGRPRVARRAALVASLGTNLGLLAVFKYADFFAVEVQGIAERFGLELSFGTLGWVLPMGISFYTFQSMSYTIDVYRGVLAPFRGFWKFLLFVSFFPQLMAGPIVRAKHFLYQIGRKRLPRLPFIYEGIYLLIQGYFLKTVVSGHLGALVDEYWYAAAAEGASSVLSLSVAVLFSFQIFADFAGYSNIARGCGYLLGFRLPVNFNSPYIATSFREFWTRWHISLSEWLRDYLYISLGGNRKGRRRTLINLLLVMAIGGLWHGAAGTFVIWGLVHGVGLVIERVLRLDGRSRERPWWLALLWFGVVQVTVVLAWVLFRAVDLDQALAILANIGSFRFAWPEGLPLFSALLVLSPVLVIHLRTLSTERLGIRAPGAWERALVAGALLYLTLTCYGVNDAFIYFQF